MQERTTSAAVPTTICSKWGLCSSYARLVANFIENWHQGAKRQMGKCVCVSYKCIGIGAYKERLLSNWIVSNTRTLRWKFAHWNFLPSAVYISNSAHGFTEWMRIRKEKYVLYIDSCFMRNIIVIVCFAAWKPQITVYFAVFECSNVIIVLTGGSP